MSEVRTRYAPSPTGVPHIGNIRTALYNFLFAKSQKGMFILRIEDTDRKRLIKGSISKIKESLKALNLDWDEEYLQSERLAVYQKHLDILKSKDLVYEDGGAFRFKVKSLSQKIEWIDVVHGQVQFSTSVIEDFIIVKSDGFPIYHFASVIDDHEMQISHVIRGDEWISSTPKHLLLYEALGWQPPKFVHIPPILGSKHQKLSKREGAKSVMEYVKEGYLPEALSNFLALLGWAPSPSEALSEGGKREKELYSLDELIKLFSLVRLNKNSPVFNLEKLNWFNKKYLQKFPAKELAIKIKRISKRAKSIDGLKLIKIIELVRDRMTTLADFEEVSRIFFEKGSLRPPAKEKIPIAKEAIESISNWSEDSIAKTLDGWIKDHKLDPADFKNTLRLAVFADNTPPIYSSLAVLTKEEVIKRIDKALA